MRVDPKLGLIVAAVLYAVIVPLHWSEGYIDFGDGNYMYISWRMANGATLYRDIMAPQPPVHLCLGTVIIKTANLLNLPDIYSFRAFSLFLHLLTLFIMYIVARRIFGRTDIASLAAIVYLILPIGFWWSLGYQSEPTEIVFLLLMVYFFMSDKAGHLVLAALFSALAVFTNMTAAPYVAFTALYALIRRPRRCLYYIIPGIIIGVIGMSLAEVITGAYFSNVIFNQVGTFPKKEIANETAFQYAIRKILSEGKDVFVWEGGFILMGVFGLYAFLRESRHHMKEFIAWFAFFSWCSIVFVSKGGTMDYIFTLGEPFVALFAAYFIWWFFARAGQSLRPLGDLKKIAADTSLLLRIILPCLMLILVFGIGVQFIIGTLKQRTFELPADDVKKVEYYINRYTQPGDTILSPPFYAFLTKRIIIEDYSENYIWTIKYWNERIIEKKPGKGVEKAQKIAAAIRQKQLPLLIVDMNQTGKLPEIRNAIEQYYTPLLDEPFQTLNTPLMFYIPAE